MPDERRDPFFAALDWNGGKFEGAEDQWFIGRPGPQQLLESEECSTIFSRSFFFDESRTSSAAKPRLARVRAAPAVIPIVSATWSYGRSSR